MQSQDYPYVKDEYKLIVDIYHTRMTILEQDDCRCLAVIPRMRTAKKQKKQLRNKGEREESFLVPKCQI